MKRNKSLKWIIFKTKIENLFLDIIFLTLPLVIALMFNLLLEMFIFVISYTFIRLEFTKAVHGSDFTKSARKGIWLCRLITTTVQIISIIFLIKLNISKFFNIILAFSLGVVNFFTKDYLEYRRKKYLEKKIFYKGMLKEELPKELTGLEYEIMYQYYVKRYLLNKIAINVRYSIDNVKKIKAKILKRYSD